MEIYDQALCISSMFELIHRLVLRPDKETLNAEKLKKELEPELLDCISNLLDDTCRQVQLTAAVTLCSLDVSEAKVSRPDCPISTFVSHFSQIMFYFGRNHVDSWIFFCIVFS